MWKKLLSIRVWKRIYQERLGEPILYNIVSIFVLIFGNFVKKINYDLVPRQPYAFGLSEAFRLAKEEQIDKVIIIEFGVASGAGLFNLAYISNKLSKIYNIDYEVLGFDTGKGMPEPIDYRDHPEHYMTGDFPSINLENAKLPKKTKIYYGDIEDTVKNILEHLNKNVKIGFVSIDVDYYSSTKKCLEIFNYNESNFFSTTPVYFDDVQNIDDNIYCGELLAIEEFNKINENRKLSKMNNLRYLRIFKNAVWIDQMYYAHILDSERRKPDSWKNNKIVKLYNPYL